jgi:hypothetical protein
MKLQHFACFHPQRWRSLSAFQQLGFAHFHHQAPPLDVGWKGQGPFNGRPICAPPTDPAAPKGGEADHNLTPEVCWWISSWMVFFMDMSYENGWFLGALSPILGYIQLVNWFSWLGKFDRCLQLDGCKHGATWSNLDIFFTPHCTHPNCVWFI